jgi:hypothetical protein
MSVRTVMEKDLHMLCEKAIRYDALDAGGVDNWCYYGDSIVEWGPYKWDDEEEAYVEDPQMIDDMVDRYTVNADSIIKNDLLDLMSLIDHKIDIYEQKTTQFADGAQSALIFVKEKLEEIVNGIEYK